MIFLSLACLAPPEDTGPQVITVTPECPAETRLALERLGEPVQVDLCEWDGVGWWCSEAEYTLGRDYLVVDCEAGGELRVSWWVE